MVPTLSAIAVPLTMLAVFASAKLMAELFERLRQPGIVGEILAGVVIGPSLLGWVAPNDILGVLSELGVMFLLFRVGLEAKSSELTRVGPTALLVAAAGVTVSFALAWGISLLWGEAHIEAVFIAAAVAATSAGISARVLSAKGLLAERASRVILAAAVIDDVLGLVVLALVSGVAKGRVNYAGVAFTAAIAIGFTGFVGIWGSRIMRRLKPLTGNLKTVEAEFSIALSLMFALSVAAVYAGVAAIIGAFLAGMALSESLEPRVHDFIGGVTELLVPFFLVGIGLNFDVSAFTSGSTLGFALVLLLAMIASKLAGCGLGAIRLGRADALRVGIGMVPRGEVGMVVAQIGLGMSVMSRNAYATVVFISVATTLVAPPLLSRAYRGVAGKTAGADEMLRLG